MRNFVRTPEHYYRLARLSEGGEDREFYVRIAKSLEARADIYEWLLAEVPSDSDGNRRPVPRLIMRNSARR